MCVIVSLAIASGASIDYYGDGQCVTDVTLVDVALSTGIGVVASRSQRAQVVAAGTLSFVSGVLQVSSPETMEFVTRRSGSSWLGGLSVGFEFNDAVMLHVHTAIPIGVAGAPTTGGIGVSFNFGKRRR